MLNPPTPLGTPLIDIMENLLPRLTLLLFYPEDGASRFRRSVGTEFSKLKGVTSK